MDNVRQFQALQSFDGERLAKTVEGWKTRKLQLAADSETKAKIRGLDRPDGRGGKRVLPDPFASVQEPAGDASTDSEV
jgi:hypothetical protein